MEMTERAWYAKWFRMSEKVWNRFRDNEHFIPREQTNICTFIRVSTLWLFLAVAANLLTWAVVLWFIVIRPARVYGFTNYLASLGGIVVIVSTVALIGGAIYLAERAKDKRDRGANARHERAAEKAEIRAAKGPGFFAIIIAYIKSRHDKICVLINIKDSRHV